MKVHVLYFAALKDQVGLPSEWIDGLAPHATIADLLLVLRQKHPGLSLTSVRIAQNEEFAADSERLADGDTLALIPPVSGG